MRWTKKCKQSKINLIFKVNSSASVVIHIMGRTTQLNKEKQQSIITLRHESQSIQKISKTLNLSCALYYETMRPPMRPRVTLFYRECH